jgi:hypothetical protein
MEHPCELASLLGQSHAYKHLFALGLPWDSYTLLHLHIFRLDDALEGTIIPKCDALFQVSSCKNPSDKR